MRLRLLGRCSAAALPLLAALVPLATSRPAWADAVPTGTVIPVTLQNARSDNNSTANYKVATDVKDASGVTIIPSGSTGVGRFIQYKRSVGWGQQGKTEVSLDTVTTPDGKTLTVNAKKTKYGSDSRFANLFFLNPILGFFAKGGSGKIGSGTELEFVAR